MAEEHVIKRPGGEEEAADDEEFDDSKAEQEPGSAEAQPTAAVDKLLKKLPAEVVQVPRCCELVVRAVYDPTT